MPLEASEPVSAIFRTKKLFSLFNSILNRHEFNVSEYYH
jgi:hypothetical protein